MLIGYARISTADQDASLQRDALKREGCERIFEETASGGKVERPQLARALEQMCKGDVLVIWKLDRLARSMKQLIETIGRLESEGVELRSLTERIDTGTAGGRLTFHIFGAMAEFERSLIRERIHAGLAAARARGRKGGRPKSIAPDDLHLAHTMLGNNFQAKDVAARLGESRATLFRALKAAKDETSVEAPAFVEDDFPAMVKHLVKGRSTKPLSSRVTIAEVYDLAQSKNIAIGTLDDFKARLVHAAREGLVDLERCDVAGVLSKVVLARSMLRLGRDVRHLIVSEG